MVEAQTLPIPFLWKRSRKRQRSTEPQPTKSAELYRLVTGGRPCKYMRTKSPAVCRRNAQTSRITAVFPSVFCPFNHENKANIRTMTDRTIAFKNGLARLNKYSSP